MIKRSVQAVKQYFIFSRSERKGILLLLILLLAVLVLPPVYAAIFPPRLDPLLIATLPAADSNEAADSVSYQLTSFDPNTANETQLIALGLSARQVSTVQNYLSKGGRFRKPQDFLKLYGLTDEQKKRLLPYVRIAQQAGRLDTARRHVRTKQVVELNTADSEQLVALYRIGPSMAHRIIEYRDKLGGFISLSQLTEIWGFDEDILYDLQGQLTVDPRKAHIHDVNTVTVEVLRNHPYFKYKLSNAVISYREQHGAYRQISDLKKVVLVNDSVYERITRYLELK